MFFYPKNFQKKFSNNIFGKKHVYFKLKVLAPILSILFLLITANLTFSSQQSDMTYADEVSNFSEESKESQDKDLLEIELLAYLNNSFFILPTLEEQEITFCCETYLSPNKTYDNPPPEQQLTVHS